MSIQVLVAEDDYFIALDVVEELDAAGFIPVGPFANISNALEYCREHTPDCAVLDVRLADGDSFLIADLLAKLHVPFLFHSAHACREALQSRYPVSAFARSPPHPRPWPTWLQTSVTPKSLSPRRSAETPASAPAAEFRD